MDSNELRAREMPCNNEQNVRRRGSKQCMRKTGAGTDAKTRKQESKQSKRYGRDQDRDSRRESEVTIA